MDLLIYIYFLYNFRIYLYRSSSYIIFHNYYLLYILFEGVIYMMPELTFLRTIAIYTLTRHFIRYTCSIAW